MALEGLGIWAQISLFNSDSQALDLIHLDIRYSTCQFLFRRKIFPN